MQLWLYRWVAIWLLRPDCTHLRTFIWFAVIVAGLTIRTELLGVTSLVRTLGLHQRFYDNLLDNFHSAGTPTVRLFAMIGLTPNYCSFCCQNLCNSNHHTGLMAYNPLH